MEDEQDNDSLKKTIDETSPFRFISLFFSRRLFTTINFGMFVNLTDLDMFILFVVNNIFNRRLLTNVELSNRNFQY